MRQWNQAQGAVDTVSSTDKVRLVVLSDTHGMEETLSGPLPAGDVLIHLGDFSMDPGKQKRPALLAFDAFLNRQPHRHKIVVRGNHDPRSWFPSSDDIQFFQKPSTVCVDNLSIAVVPFGYSTPASKRCDVLLSHVPPKDILDRTVYRNQHAGSAKLRYTVAQMSRPPSLWLVGHIHEVRR